MFCLQKEGGISSLKVETLDPSLGQYDVVWLLDRAEAEGAWQLGQVTSYLVIYNYIYNHIHVSAGEHHGAEHLADRGAGGGGEHRLRRRGRLPRVRRRGQVRHPARGGEVSCDWSAECSPLIGCRVDQLTTTTAHPGVKFPDCSFETDECGWSSGDNIDNTTGMFLFIRCRHTISPALSPICSP